MQASNKVKADSLVTSGSYLSISDSMTYEKKADESSGRTTAVILHIKCLANIVYCTNSSQVHEIRSTTFKVVLLHVSEYVLIWL